MKLIVSSEKEAVDICNALAHAMIEVSAKATIHPITAQRIMQQIAGVQASVEVIGPELDHVGKHIKVGRMTCVTEDGRILFHPADLPDGEGMTIINIAKTGRYDALEAIGEYAAYCEQILGRIINVKEPEENGNEEAK